MKVPFPANNPKPLNNYTTNPTPRTPTNSPYEPKSVLDLRGSPSPVTDQKPVPTTTVDNSLDHLQLEDHAPGNNLLEDWDSVMRELGLNDDPTTPVSKPVHNPDSQTAPTQYSSLPEFPPPGAAFDPTHFVPADFGLLPDVQTYSTAPLTSFESFSGDLSWNAEFEYVDELIRLAECFEKNSLQLGHVLLARLNQRLSSPSGKPLHRAAFYFKEALQSLLTVSTRPPHHPASSSDIIQTIKAQKTFSTISPIPMFASFTANQAVLEALDGSVRVHVIDFDIGLGGHWASFMKELAEKAESRKGGAAAPVLRISALVPEDYAMESMLVRENLSQFARDLNIRFDIDFILIRSFEYLSFKAVKFMDGEKVAVLLSPAIFRQVGTGFLNDLRRLSPHVVVHVDTEGQMGFGTASYRQALIDGLEFYSTLLESLEAANYSGGGGGGGGGVGDWMRRIETFVLFPKILEGVEAAGRRGMPWREALMASGLRQVGLSQFADFQAECLLRRVQVRGFQVVKRQAEMMLCWHDRPLVAASAWRY